MIQMEMKQNPPQSWCSWPFGTSSTLHSQITTKKDTWQLSHQQIMSMLSVLLRVTPRTINVWLSLWNRSASQDTRRECKINSPRFIMIFQGATHNGTRTPAVEWDYLPPGDFSFSEAMEFKDIVGDSTTDMVIDVMSSQMVKLANTVFYCCRGCWTTV